MVCLVDGLWSLGVGGLVLGFLLLVVLVGVGWIVAAVWGRELLTGGCYMGLGLRGCGPCVGGYLVVCWVACCSG